MFPAPITLSRRWHLPVFNFLGSTFALWDRSFWRAMDQFEIEGDLPHVKVAELFDWMEDGPFDDIRFTHKPSGSVLRMHLFYFKNMLREWLVWRQWDRWYIPPTGIAGKTVLSIGEGEGDTALFYLQHGAKKVIAVEIWPPAVERLVENAKANSWPVEVIAKPFSLDMLSLDYDVMKMDIEGCEELLLRPEVEGLSGLASIEAHSKELIDSLSKKFFMRRVDNQNPTFSVLVNW